VGSSFAFIAVGGAAVSLGDAYLCIGALSSCVTYLIVSLIIARLGPGWVQRILPPVVIGPIVAVIGLSLAGTAISQSFRADGAFSPEALIIAVVTLVIIILAMYSKNRFISSISILVGLVGGYILTLILSRVPQLNFKQFLTFKAPDHVFNNPFSFFVNPFNAEGTTALVVGLSFVITSFATICEHIGHTLVTGDIIGEDIVRSPGLHRTIAGDGVATGIAGLFGSVCNTTYGESLGVMVTTRVFSVFVFVLAAFLAIILSCIAPFGELVRSLPVPVLGGACILLYGTIASNGLKQIVTNGIDFDKRRNMIIVSVIFILGVGGASIPMFFSGRMLELLSAVALAAVVGIVLNLVLPQGD
jgi:uracil permease